jgi:NADPH:quinone reductase-like Zn-dependent oxidoreductase
VLIIAGSDSSGGAGIQADLKTFAAHGVYGVSAITAVTAQNTLGVVAWQALPADLVASIKAGKVDMNDPASKVALKPANLSFEQAAVVPVSGLTALQALTDVGRVKTGQRVLIIGASGGVGTFAVQLAKALGAEVTAVCSTRNVDTARSLGADHVIDYTQEDFTQGGPRYDLILDNAGNHSLSELRRALAPTGRLIPNSGSAGLGTFITAFVSSPFLRQQGRPYLSVPKLKDLTFLKELIEAGKVTPAIDRTYPLSDAADAFRYLGNGHARGKVVITT